MQIWILSGPTSTKELADSDGSDIYDAPIECQFDPGHWGAGQRRSNLSLVLPSQNFKDIIWTWMSECLLQDHVLEQFNKQKFRGFETRPAHAKLPKRSQSVRLHELVITGWGGMAPPSSGIRLIEECKPCGHRVYSFYRNPSLIFDQSKWDGSDFFMVWPLPRYIFVTDRVRQSIVDAGFRGAKFQKPSDLKLGLSDTLTPGRLSNWMPPERAKYLEDTLEAESRVKH
jgi:hypothetical protein